MKEKVKVFLESEDFKLEKELKKGIIYE